MEQLPSNLLNDAVEELHRLPGIGRKTALRLALFLLKEDLSMVEKFGNTLIEMRKNIRFCKICHNISDSEICPICAQVSRDNSIICVVSDIRDIIAIENTGSYKGTYHVLGGLISPIEGIAPSHLHLQSLLSRVQENEIKEVILALPATTDGDITSMYIQKLLSPCQILLTSIAKGIAIGDDLEYTDEVTLGKSLLNRLPL